MTLCADANQKQQNNRSKVSMSMTIKTSGKQSSHHRHVKDFLEYYFSIRVFKIIP
jgi:hypothetical protein